MGALEDRGDFAAQQPERRCDLRYSVDEDSIILFIGHGAPKVAYLVDLSQDGCRLRTSDPIAARSRLPVEVFFTIEGISFRFRGVLQWTDGHHLAGIRFVNTMPQRLLELANVICTMEKTAAARANVVDLLIAEQQGTQSRGRETMALAGDADRMAAAGALANPHDFAPIDGTEFRPQAREASSGGERRRELRYEVDTTATILPINIGSRLIGSRLHGRILDLSPMGCRIRTEERFPLEIYTRVETEFRLGGLPFQLGGVVQAIHDRSCVGIRFLDLSEHKREEVLDLIAEIEKS